MTLWFRKRTHGRVGGTPVMRTRSRPSLESLERRELLASGSQPYVLTGDHWSNATPITFSIAADGVTWDRKPNALNAAFGARIAPGTWQREIARALQTWAAVADLDFVRVADSGLRFDALGKPQGDPRFGDIRFGGYDFGNKTELAHAYTPPPNGSTAAGDVAVNTAMTYNVGSQYDLYSVLLHETGHSLGLEHTASPTAVMGAGYVGLRTGLTSADIAGIRAIYGARVDDVYGMQGKGAGFSTAVDVAAGRTAPSQVTLEDLVLTKVGDSDYFSVVPASAGTLQVTAMAKGVSLLSPQVDVYNSSKSLLDAEGSPSKYGLDVTASVAGVVAGQRYYIKVAGATSDVFSIGTYDLKVAMAGGGTVGTPSPPPVSATTPAPPVVTPSPPPVSAAVPPPSADVATLPETPSVAPPTSPVVPPVVLPPLAPLTPDPPTPTVRPSSSPPWRRQTPRVPAEHRAQLAAWRRRMSGKAGGQANAWRKSLGKADRVARGGPSLAPAEIRGRSSISKVDANPVASILPR